MSSVSKGKGTHRHRPEYLRKQFKAIIARDPFCHYCGEELVTTGSPYQDLYATVDHIIPKSRGGSDEPDNLVPACRRCNITMNDKRPKREPGVPMDEPRRGWADEQRGRVVSTNIYPEPTPEDLERVAGEPYMNLPGDRRTPRERYMTRWSRTWF